MQRGKAVKKVEIAIDKMVVLQDAGYGCECITRILERLNELRGRIEGGDLNGLRVF